MRPYFSGDFNRNAVISTPPILLCILAATLTLSGCWEKNPSGNQPLSGNPGLGHQVHGVIVKDPQLLGLNEKQLVLYFSQSNGSHVILAPVIRELPSTSTVSENKTLSHDERIQTVLKDLFSGPTDAEKERGLYSEIPTGVTLLGVKHSHDDSVRINVSEQFLSGGGSNSMQQRLAELTQTVRAIEKEHPVFLDINGKELHELGGEGLSVTEPINSPKNTASNHPG
ncbi:MAG: GerMN domain-containing protein [Cyanobacteria bacterium]|nr:GerMN domain-containing protein [Cyanobacteriota bacterium]